MVDIILLLIFVLLLLVAVAWCVVDLIIFIENFIYAAKKEVYYNIYTQVVHVILLLFFKSTYRYNSYYTVKETKIGKRIFWTYY